MGVKCSKKRADGKPCRAWALRESDPPICATHDGRTGGGAPKGNQNRVVHGFYGRSFTLEEIADLVAYAVDMTLEDELAMVRVAVRRVMVKLKEEILLLEDFARLVKLVFGGAMTIARLLRAKRILSGESADSISAAIAIVLDELTAEFEMEL